MNFERVHCEIKCVLEIEGILLKDDEAKLQLKVYECMVRPKVYERSALQHVKILDMEW